MGKLALAGVRPAETPFPEWCDAFWAVYADYLLVATTETAEHVEGVWEEITAPRRSPSARRRRALPSSTGDAGPGRATADVPPWRAEGRKPTPAEVAEWTGGAAAQRGADGLFEIAGVRPPGADETGE